MTERETANYVPTLRELKSVAYLDKEIQNLSETLNEIENASVVGAKSYINSCRTSNYNRYSKVEKKALAIVTIKTALENKIVELQELYDNILHWIFNIDDSLIRMVFKLRYLDCLTWNQVADKVGGYNTESSVKKMQQRYLEREQNRH